MSTAEILKPQWDAEEDTSISPVSSDVLTSVSRAEIAQQIEIARKYPRNLEKVLFKLDQMACYNQDIALSMFYSLPRKTKGGGTTQIIGPSVRFAEALICAWGNARAGVKLLGVQDKVYIAQGAFFDCENNVGISVEAQRRVTDSNGRMFSEDMITVTGNAAASVAYRNAIFRGVPKGIWMPVYQKAMKVAAGQVTSLTAELDKAIKTFNTLGITDLQVLNALGLNSLRDATHEHLVTLRVLYKDVTSGDKTVEEVFGTAADSEIENLMRELGFNEAKKKLTWQEYKGRREDLLKYLQTEAERDRKAGVKPSNGQPSSTATPAASVSEAAGQVAETTPEQEQAAGSGTPAATQANPSEALGALKAATSGRGTAKKGRFF